MYGGDALNATGRRKRLEEGSGLYLILTSPVIPHIELAAAACERGVPVLQLREKHLPDEELLRIASGIADVTRDTGTLLIVNDRPDIAAAAGADGVHVGQSDESVTDARALLGSEALIGLSTSTPVEAEAARSAGADYIGIGPVFPTDTKPDALPPIGLTGLRRVAARVPDLPGVAIGGITRETAADVVDAGARYVAVISAICQADDPIKAMDDFLLAVGGPGHRGTGTTGDA